ncbi:hypothetical protein CEXT_421721 [Caerostris extrusa]|uniref:RNase H type-1 domain-containing protein n=1 Tax=Caerostris extrusa TaxID=172846 RepID=A0AAV4WXA0_CAEEX|nr:hypothetical protein CEXT_421721 [Caerostris extrusa]
MLWNSRHRSTSSSFGSTTTLKFQQKLYRLRSDEACLHGRGLKAIEAAIISANAHHFPRSKIISDSRSVLQALSNPNNCTAPLKSLLGNSETACLSIKHIKTELARPLRQNGNFNGRRLLKGRAVHELCQHVCSQRIHGNYFLNLIITGHGALASYQHKFSTPVSMQLWSHHGVWHWAVRRDLCLGPGFSFVLMLQVAVATPFIISRMPPWGGSNPIRAYPRGGEGQNGRMVKYSSHAEFVSSILIVTLRGDGQRA